MDILEKALKKSLDIHENDTVNTEIKTEAVSEVKQILQQTVKIDWNKLKKEGYISNDETKRALIEEFRVIKRPILSNAFGTASQGINRSNLVLVTSSIPNEGKTFSAINLALSIVNERDKKVLLIDADVAKPSIAKRLGMKDSLGLIDYLESDNLTFTDISLKTDLDGLQVIPAGRCHAFSTELLSSDKMARFVTELSERYPDRLVIFDSPPILAATQAEILATLVGQVILVIAAETTVQSTVQDALKKLESVDVLLALLNKAKHGLSMGYYNYGKYGH